jgi:Tfp pilus assembly protein PilN
MIRINLLGAPKPKNKRSYVPQVNFEIGEAGSPKLKFVAVLLLASAFNGLNWYRINKEKQSIAVKMQDAQAENQRLAEVKQKYLERQRQADNYKRRVDVIDQLRASQSGPVNLLNTIGDTVNSTEAVWLSTMKDTGNSVDIQGMALSTDAVADLIQNLQKTGYFRNIEIKETYQDETYKEMQAFQFTLTCEKGKS